MKAKHLLLLLSGLVFSTSLSAQIVGFNYQGVLRHNDFSAYKNQNVVVFLNILSQPSGGTLLYAETHSNVITDQLGHFNLVIGQGVPTNGA